MMKSIYQQILSLVLFSILLLVSAFSYALPFIVVPKAGTSLPTTIAPGQTATAFYTVTNNTLRTLPGSFVKYLPLNVTQVTSPAIAPNLCGSTFNLVSGGSCTLGLTVSGAVNAADPDRHHHLFVCTAHVPACAGTDYPLNVISVPALISLAITPLNRLIAIGTKLQYTATGTYSNDTTQNITTSVNWTSSDTSVATMPSNTGLASSAAIGSTIIKATSGSLSGCTQLTVKPQFAYITNALANNTVSVCPINLDGTFGTCILSATVFNDPRGITLNSTYTYAYVANFGNNTVSICPLNNDGSLNTGSCTTSTGNGTFVRPAGVLINSAATIIYVTNDGNTTLSICSLGVDGAIGTCSTTSGPDSHGTPTFSNPTSAVFNSSQTLIYVTNVLGNTISICPVNADGSLGACSASNPGELLNTPVTTVLNSANTFAYTTNFGNNNIIICPINADGSLNAAACTATGDVSFNQVEGISLNAANTILYVADFGSNHVSLCPITGGGTSFGTCSTSVGNGTFTNPFSAYIH